MPQPTTPGWMKRHRVINLTLVGIVLAFIVLSTFEIPGWAVAAFVVVVLVVSIGLTPRRMRQEHRLVRAIWQVVTGK